MNQWRNKGILHEWINLKAFMIFANISSRKYEGGFLILMNYEIDWVSFIYSQRKLNRQ